MIVQQNWLWEVNYSSDNGDNNLKLVKIEKHWIRSAKILFDTPLKGHMCMKVKKILKEKI